MNALPRCGSGFWTFDGETSGQSRRTVDDFGDHRTGYMIIIIYHPHQGSTHCRLRGYDVLTTLAQLVSLEARC